MSMTFLHGALILSAAFAFVIGLQCPPLNPPEGVAFQCLDPNNGTMDCSTGNLTRGVRIQYRCNNDTSGNWANCTLKCTCKGRWKGRTDFQEYSTVQCGSQNISWPEYQNDSSTDQEGKEDEETPLEPGPLVASPGNDTGNTSSQSGQPNNITEVMANKTESSTQTSVDYSSSPATGGVSLNDTSPASSDSTTTPSSTSSNSGSSPLPAPGSNNETINASTELPSNQTSTTASSLSNGTNQSSSSSDTTTPQPSAGNKSTVLGGASETLSNSTDSSSTPSSQASSASPGDAAPNSSSPTPLPPLSETTPSPSSSSSPQGSSDSQNATLPIAGASLEPSTTIPSSSSSTGNDTGSTSTTAGPGLEQQTSPAGGSSTDANNSSSSSSSGEPNTTTPSSSSSSMGSSAETSSPTTLGPSTDDSGRESKDIKFPNETGRNGTTSGSSSEASPTTTPSSTDSSTPGLGNSTDFKTFALDLHNKIRRNHEAGPLVLNDTLNQLAQSWADTLMNSSKLEATPGKRTYAENIFKISGGRKVSESDAVEGAIRSWYSSHTWFNYSSPKPTGFSQMIWNATTQLGIGLASKDDTAILVATYYPRGNVVAVGPKTDRTFYFKKNVFPQISNPEPLPFDKANSTSGSN